PGTDLIPAPPVPDVPAVPELVLVASEERAAMRTFLRALRLLPSDPPWHATVFSPRPIAPPATLGRALRDRITFVDAEECTEAEVLARAGIVVLASEGDRPAPGTLVRALGAGVVPVASRLPVYEELLGEGERGLLFEPGEAQTLASHLQRLIAEPGLGTRMVAAARELRRTLTWSRVATELEQTYDQLVA